MGLNLEKERKTATLPTRLAAWRRLAECSSATVSHHPRPHRDSNRGGAASGLSGNVALAPPCLHPHLR